MNKAQMLDQNERTHLLSELAHAKGGVIMTPPSKYQTMVAAIAAYVKEQNERNRVIDGATMVMAESYLNHAPLYNDVAQYMRNSMPQN